MESPEPRPEDLDPEHGPLPNEGDPDSDPPPEVPVRSDLDEDLEDRGDA